MRTLTKILAIGTFGLVGLIGCTSTEEKPNIPAKPEHGIGTDWYGIDSPVFGIGDPGKSDEYEVERRKEWTRRNLAFYRCDKDKNGILDEEENKNYLKEASFKHRFR